MDRWRHVSTLLIYPGGPEDVADNPAKEPRRDLNPTIDSTVAVNGAQTYRPRSVSSLLILFNAISQTCVCVGEGWGWKWFGDGILEGAANSRSSDVVVSH